MLRIALASELRRLILALERDLVAQARLRTMLTDADTTVADRRRDVRTLKKQMKSQPAKR
jgi:hypothetical protein